MVVAIPHQSIEQVVHYLLCLQDNYSYGRPPPVTSYETKPQYYQTSIAPAQRTPAESYYQTSEWCKLCPLSIQSLFLSYVLTVSRFTLTGAYRIACGSVLIGPDLKIVTYVQPLEW